MYVMSRKWERFAMHELWVVESNIFGATRKFSILLQIWRIHQYMRAIQGHSRRNKSDPLLLDNVGQPYTRIEYFYHVGSFLCLYSFMHFGFLQEEQVQKKQDKRYSWHPWIIWLILKKMNLSTRQNHERSNRKLNGKCTKTTVTLPRGVSGNGTTTLGNLFYKCNARMHSWTGDRTIFKLCQNTPRFMSERRTRTKYPILPNHQDGQTIILVKLMEMTFIVFTVFAFDRMENVANVVVFSRVGGPSMIFWIF